jgi:hypothetical protein
VTLARHSRQRACWNSFHRTAAQPFREEERKTICGVETPVRPRFFLPIRKNGDIIGFDAEASSEKARCSSFPGSAICADAFPNSSSPPCLKRFLFSLQIAFMRHCDHGNWKWTGIVSDQGEFAMRTTLGIGSVLSLVAGLAAAGGIPPQSSKPLSEVLTAVEQKGVTAVGDVSFDDGVWEVEGYRGQQAVELHVHPQSLAILFEHPDEPHERPAANALSAAAIAKHLEQAGYGPILDLEWEYTLWTAEAVNQQGLRDLTISAQTGKVLTDRIED